MDGMVHFIFSNFFQSIPTSWSREIPTRQGQRTPLVDTFRMVGQIYVHNEEQTQNDPFSQQHHSSSSTCFHREEITAVSYSTTTSYKQSIEMRTTSILGVSQALLLPTLISSYVQVQQHVSFLNQKRRIATTGTTSTRTTSTKLHSTVVGQPSNSYYQPSLINLPASMGDADCAFRHGTNLELQGLSRTAHAAYHEAATLYQCFLDQDFKTNDFSHVTELDNGDGEDSCRRYLAEVCMRLACISIDALGDPRAAIRLYKEASKIDPKPNVCAYDGIGTAIEASFPNNLMEAVQAYQKALEIEDNKLSRFHLGVALERMGEESEEIMDEIRRSEAKYACLVDSWGYIR